jgi:hypothetical protein
VKIYTNTFDYVFIIRTVICAIIMIFRVVAKSAKADYNPAVRFIDANGVISANADESKLNMLAVSVTWYDGGLTPPRPDLLYYRYAISTGFNEG